MKKLSLFFLILTILATNIFAQEFELIEYKSQENTKIEQTYAKNWISGEVSVLYPVGLPFIMPGLGFNYDRMLGPKVSLGINLYMNIGGKYEYAIDDYPPYNILYLFDGSILTGINVLFRYYPGAKTFYFGGALGLIFYFPFGEFYEKVYKNGEHDSDSLTTLAVFSIEIGWRIKIRKTKGLYLQPGIITQYLWNFDKIFFPDFFRDCCIKPYFGIGYSF